MLFNTLDFAIFFCIVLGAYGLLPRRGQNILLLGSSYFFYGYWDWRFLGLIWLSTLSAHVAARVMAATSSPARKKVAAAGGIVLNLGLLGTFKYYNFFADNLALALGNLGLDVHWIDLSLVLPVGISFFTFQATGYLVDVYRGSYTGEKKLADTALFLAFFPQLVAGPIERAARLLPQLKGERKRSAEQFCDGIYLLAWGLFKKVFIADNLAHLVERVFGQSYPGLDGVVVLIALYAFAIQIYCDFSGYTDIARGVAKCFGIELMINFNLPYLATSPRDFWKRWHISLSEWLRDYLYIPLGGNRKGRFRALCNLMITMLLGGLWHGAAWTFVLWGGFHGALLIAHRVFQQKLELDSQKWSRTVQRTWLFVRVLFMFHLTCYGWLLFRASSTHQIGRFTHLLLFEFRPSMDILALGWHVLFYAWPLLLMQVFQALRGRLNVLYLLPWPLRSLLYAGGFYLLIIFGAFESREFIYFQF